MENKVYFSKKNENYLNRTLFTNKTNAFINNKKLKYYTH